MSQIPSLTCQVKPLKNLTLEEMEIELIWAENSTCAQQVLQNLKHFTSAQQVLFRKAKNLALSPRSL